MRSYLNSSFLNSNKNKNMPITKALSKYGQNNFALLILEYVETDSMDVILRPRALA